jgi:NAD(P)H-nitrite reductase large subunit
VGEKELEAVVTNHGEHAATLVGVGIGIEPDFSWLQDAGVQTNAAIVTNEFLQTNVPDIYAAGDCAEFFDVIVSRQLQIGNWMNAMSQGRTVAKSMTGERTPFRLVSSYATNILGLDIIFIADVEKAAAEQIYTIGSVESGGITQVFERDGQVVGGALIGRNSDRPAMTKAIQEQQSAIDILAKIK